MLKIRLQRVGRKHEPVFRLVLTDSKNSTKSGRYQEILGSFDARRGEKSDFKTERIQQLIKNGAQTSVTVHNLLVTKKTITGKKINALPLKKAIIKDAPAVPAESPKPKVEEKVAETPKEVVVEAAIESEKVSE